MRIFVTGASGHLGSLVTEELLSHGHQVTGLARSDASAAKLEALGADVQRGDLDDLDGLKAAASAADGVIHLAFRHDLSFNGLEGVAQAGAIDLVAIQALGDALDGTGKPLATTGGSMLLAFDGTSNGHIGTEDDVVADSSPSPRVASENATIALAERGVRSMVLRLAPTNHGPADEHGFITALVNAARERGASAYVGDGLNRWPAVHDRDTAVLYRLAIEQAPAGSRLHGVAEEGIPFKQIAEAIGRQLDVPAVSLDAGQVAGLGLIGFAMTTDNPTSSAKTRELLGWEPTHPGLLEDIDSGVYNR